MARQDSEKRPYQQKRRAEQTAETRQRIVEAAVDLHSTMGPARTTWSMIAERAGVQRHTLYAHFPEERDLFLACSGHFLERDPLPDPRPWREIDRPRNRLKVGLGAVYEWFGRNAETLAAVLRDAEHHPLTREIVALRQGPTDALYRKVLGEGLNEQQRAMLHLALAFPTWRSLVIESSMTGNDAAEMMAAAILGKK